MGRRCEDVDECVWDPCLHGGTCYNQRPGYLCVCAPDHLGDNCQWNKVSREIHPLTVPVAVAVLTVSVLVIGKLGSFSFCTISLPLFVISLYSYVFLV